MVICLAVRRIWTHGLGGMETHAQMLAGELVRQGHAVHVVTTAHPRGLREEVQLGARIHYLPGTPPGDYSRAWWRTSGEWARAHCRPLGVDAILSMSFAARTMGWFPGASPVFFIVHGHGWPQLKSAWHDSRGATRLVRFPLDALRLVYSIVVASGLLRRAAGVFAVSRELSEQLRRYRTHFVPNVVDTRRFRPDADRRSRTRAELGAGPDDLVALMVGTVNWQKGVDLGLSACAEAAATAPGLRAAVVGDGPALDSLREWTRTEAPHLPTTFVGPVPLEKLPPYYAAADIFLFPSRRQEGLPTTVLEAMASGLPVVATRSGGTPTAVRDCETGLLTSINDSRGFTEALRALIRDPARRRALGAAGRRHAEETFDVRPVVARLVEIMGRARC